MDGPQDADHGWVGTVDEGRLREVLAVTGPVLVLGKVCDDAGRVVDFTVEAINAAAAAALRRPAADLVGSGLAALGTPPVDGSLIALCGDVADGGEPFSGIVEWFDEGGVFVDVRITRVRDGCVVTGWDATEARLAEQVVELVDAAVDAVMSIDADARFVYWSRAAERMYGWTAAEAIGQPASLLVTDDQRGELDRMIAAGRAGERLVVETVRRRKDGSTFPVEIAVAPILDRAGRVVRSAAVHRDISERVAVRAELEATQTRLQLVVDHSTDAITLHRGRLVEWCSPAVEGIFGLRPEALVGRDLVDFLHPDDVGQLSAARERLAAEKAVELAMRIRHLDGSWHWVEIRVAAVGGPDPADVQVANWQLIDDKMAALAELEVRRAELAESERRYRLVVENSRDAIAVTASGVLQWASPVFEELTGVDPDDLIGTQVLDLIHPDDHNVLEATRARIFAGLGEQAPQQIRFRHADGSWHWAQLRIGPYVDDNGDTVGAVSSWRLVDDQVAYVDALARSEARNRELASQLQKALDSRVLIEQAKGMVAAQHGISPDEAFDVIRDHGRRHSRKLQDVAHEVVELGLRP